MDWFLHDGSIGGWYAKFCVRVFQVSSKDTRLTFRYVSMINLKHIQQTAQHMKLGLVYSEPSQTSEMERYAKIGNGF